MILSKWLGSIRQLERYVWVSRLSQAMSLTVGVCDSMNTLYLLVEETEIVRLVGGTYTSYSQGKAE